MDSPQVENAANSSPDPDSITEVGLKTMEKVAIAVLKKKGNWKDFEDLRDKLMAEMW